MVVVKTVLLCDRLEMDYPEGQEVPIEELEECAAEVV